MSHLNQLQMSREIKNLKLLVSNLKKEMDDIKQTNINIYNELNSIKNDITNNTQDIKLNYVHQDELVGFLDDIKHDILELNKKFDNVSNLTLKSSALCSDDKFEIYNFLKDNNIDSKYINIILALNISSLEEILLLNKNDLVIFGIPNYVVDDLFSIIKTFIEQTFHENNLPIEEMSTSNV